MFLSSSFSIFLLFFITIFLSIKSESDRRRHQRHFEFNSENSFTDAITQHNKRVTFYKDKLTAWKNNHLVDLIENVKTLEIYLMAKRNFDKDTSLKLKWKYYLNSCDFFPLKEILGEYIMSLVETKPEIGSELFLNTILLTYQILYYRNPSPAQTEAYYNKVWFKGKEINRRVFKFNLHKKIQTYYSDIIDAKSYKGGINYFNEEERELAKEFGIDISTSEILNEVFDHILKSLNDDIKLFDSDPSNFFINKYKYDKENASPLNDKDIKIHRGVLDALKNFISNKNHFFSVFQYVVKSLQAANLNFFGGRYQGQDKTDFEFYLKKVGVLSENCYYVGPLLDLLDTQFFSMNKNNKKIDSIKTDLEFTSFNDASVYFIKDNPQLHSSDIVIEKNSFMRSSYNFTMLNDKLLLEFRPDLLYNSRLDYSNKNLYLLNNVNSTNFESYSKSFKVVNSINSIMPSLENTLDGIEVFVPITKQQFSSNQYKLCKMISCGGSKTILNFLDDNTVKNTQVFNFPSILSPFEVNYEFYNLMRVLEYDEYISTMPIDDMDEFIGKFIHRKPIVFNEDIKSWAKYLEILMQNDKSTKSYLFILQDYIKIKYTLNDRPIYKEELNEKFFDRKGNYYNILKVALNKKSSLYKHFNLVLDRIKKRIEGNISDLKSEILKYYELNN